MGHGHYYYWVALILLGIWMKGTSDQWPVTIPYLGFNWPRRRKEPNYLGSAIFGVKDQILKGSKHIQSTLVEGTPLYCLATKLMLVKAQLKIRFTAVGSFRTRTLNVQWLLLNAEKDFETNSMDSHHAAQVNNGRRFETDIKRRFCRKKSRVQ